MIDPGSKISILILTHDEENNLPECLQSVRSLAAPVFVLDSGSKDRTVELAERNGAQVFAHPFSNYAEQRNWGLQNLPILTEWILHLDADERLSPSLVQEISEIFQKPVPEDGFLFRKRTFFMGRWIKHGGHYPSYHLRLFRRSKGFCEDRLYDQHFVVDGATKTLRNDYSDVLTSDLKIWTTRHARWADLEAREVLRKTQRQNRLQPRWFGTPIERKRWLREELYARLPLFVRPLLYWIYRYFLRLGFLDGKEGLIFHFLQGFWYRFLVDAKIYELKRNRNGVEAVDLAIPASERYVHSRD